MFVSPKNERLMNRKIHLRKKTPLLGVVATYVRFIWIFVRIVFSSHAANSSNSYNILRHSRSLFAFDSVKLYRVQQLRLCSCAFFNALDHQFWLRWRKKKTGKKNIQRIIIKHTFARIFFRCCQKLFCNFKQKYKKKLNVCLREK